MSVGIYGRTWAHFSSTPAVSRKKIKLSSASADFAETKRTDTMGIAKFSKKIEETLLNKVQNSLGTFKPEVLEK